MNNQQKIPTGNSNFIGRIEEEPKLTEEHSRSQIENKLTTTWLKKKKTNRQMIVHETQHKQNIQIKQHELHQKLGMI